MFNENVKIVGYDGEFYIMEDSWKHGPRLIAKVGTSELTEPVLLAKRGENYLKDRYEGEGWALALHEGDDNNFLTIDGKTIKIPWSYAVRFVFKEGGLVQ